ncbi:MAG TPA: hypothetical protein VGL39_13375 [Jatrophihabitantaceae bacterium]
MPKPKAQRNFTDPDSKIMKASDGSLDQCFNPQAVVDDEHQVIVATDLDDCAADVANLIPMTDQATRNTGHAPEQVLADAGHCSAGNLDAAAQFTDRHGSQFFIATGRRSHDDPEPVAPRGPIPKTATGKQRMARKLKTKTGRAAYARRKGIVPTVTTEEATRRPAAPPRRSSQSRRQRAGRSSFSSATRATPDRVTGWPSTISRRIGGRPSWTVSGVAGRARVIVTSPRTRKPE